MIRFLLYQCSDLVNIPWANMFQQNCLTLSNKRDSFSFFTFFILSEGLLFSAVAAVPDFFSGNKLEQVHELREGGKNPSGQINYLRLEDASPSQDANIYLQEPQREYITLLCWLFRSSHLRNRLTVCTEKCMIANMYKLQPIMAK